MSEKTQQHHIDKLYAKAISKEKEENNMRYFKKYQNSGGKYKTFKKFSELLKCLFECSDNSLHITNKVFIEFCKMAKLSFKEGEKVVNSVHN